MVESYEEDHFLKCDREFLSPVIKFSQRFNALRVQLLSANLYETGRRVCPK